jgi:hypothetical protein
MSSRGRLLAPLARKGDRLDCVKGYRKCIPQLKKPATILKLG